MIYNLFMKYLYLDWQIYHTYAFDLSQKIIKDNNHFDLIVTVARGGFTLSHILSDFIDLPIASFTISSYHDLKQTTIPKIVFKLGDKLHNKKILFVDDISDTGKTFVRGLQYLKSMGGNSVRTASMIIKSETEFVPDYFIKSVPKTTWVIFPHEMKESVVTLSKKMSKKELEAIKIPKHFIDHYAG